MDQIVSAEVGEQHLHNVDPDNSLIIQPRFLNGFERSLPSFDHLFLECQEAIDEKNLHQLELEHETQIAEDLQIELNYYQRALERKTTNIREVTQRVAELDKIEEIHRDLKATIKNMEEKISAREEETKAAIQSAKQSAQQVAKIQEQEFQFKINELEAKFGTEVYELRENLKRKADNLRTAKYKADLEHSKRKEELRRNVANRIKSTSHHIECRSVELDLKKQLVRLEKEVKQLEQQRSRRKLPLSFSGENSERTSVQQHPDQQVNKRPTPTPTKQQAASSSITPPQNPPRGGARKRKLFSVNSDFLDFLVLSWTRVHVHAPEDTK